MISALEEESHRNRLVARQHKTQWKMESIFDELKQFSDVESEIEGHAVLAPTIVSYSSSDDDDVDDRIVVDEKAYTHGRRSLQESCPSEHNVKVLTSKPVQTNFYEFSKAEGSEQPGVIAKQDIAEPSYSKVSCLLSELEQHFLAIANEEAESYDQERLNDVLVQADFEVESEKHCCTGCKQLEDCREHFNKLEQELVKINETLSQFYQCVRIANKERTKVNRRSTCSDSGNERLDSDMEHADSAFDDTDIRIIPDRADSAFDSLDDPDSQTSDIELDATLTPEHVHNESFLQGGPCSRPGSPRRLPSRDVMYNCEFYVEAGVDAGQGNVMQYPRSLSQRSTSLSKLNNNNPCFNSIERIYQNLEKLKSAIEIIASQEEHAQTASRRKSSANETEEFCEQVTTVKRIEYRCECHDELICEEIHNITSDSNQLKKKLIKSEYVTL